MIVHCITIAFYFFVVSHTKALDMKTFLSVSRSIGYTQFLSLQFSQHFYSLCLSIAYFSGISGIYRKIGAKTIHDIYACHSKDG